MTGAAVTDGRARRPTRRVALFVVLLGLAWARPVAAQQFRALVMGIDSYEHAPALRGSVNDATLLARALAAPVTRAIVMLLNDQVHRETVLAAMDDLLAASEPGDTVMVAFSGHGSIDRNPGYSQGFRLFWAMQDYDPINPNVTPQAIYSDEIGAWLARASARGVRAILLSDSCFSGRIYRGSGVDLPKIRSLPSHHSAGTAEATDVPITLLGQKEPAPPPGVTSLAGARSTAPVAEIVAPDGKPHGALSYSFADALMEHRAAIAPGRDGKVLQGALLQHLQDEILALSNDAQQPQLRSADPDDTVLFRLPAYPGAPAAPTAPRPPGVESGPVAVHVSGVDPEKGRAMVEAVAGAVWEADAQNAQLIWQIAERRPARLINELNTVVSFDAGQAEMPSMIEAFRSARTLDRRAIDSGLHIVLFGTKGASPSVWFPPGEVALQVDGLSGGNLVVFNLAHDGTVQNLYPDPRDFRPVVSPARAFEIRRLAVRPPFGADHVVAVSSEGSLSVLRSEIRELDQRQAAAAAQKSVERALAADPTARLAVATLYTAPGEHRCDADLVRDAAMLTDCDVGRPP